MIGRFQGIPGIEMPFKLRLLTKESQPNIKTLFNAFALFPQYILLFQYISQPLFGVF